jgi:hypothetical protein
MRNLSPTDAHPSGKVITIGQIALVSDYCLFGVGNPESGIERALGL